MATSKSDIFEDQDKYGEEECVKDLSYTTVVPIDDPSLKPVKEYIYIYIYFCVFKCILIIYIIYIEKK